MSFSENNEDDADSIEDDTDPEPMLKRFKDTIKNTKSKISFDFDGIKETTNSIFDDIKEKLNLRYHWRSNKKKVIGISILFVGKVSIILSSCSNINHII